MFVIAIHFALNLLKSFRKEKMFIFPEPKHKLMQTFSQMQKKTLKIHKTNDDNVQCFLPFPIFVVVSSVQSHGGAHSLDLHFCYKQPNRIIWYASVDAERKSVQYFCFCCSVQLLQVWGKITIFQLWIFPFIFYISTEFYQISWLNCFKMFTNCHFVPHFPSTSERWHRFSVCKNIYSIPSGIKLP